MSEVNNISAGICLIRKNAFLNLLVYPPPNSTILFVIILKSVHHQIYIALF